MDMERNTTNDGELDSGLDSESSINPEMLWHEKAPWKDEHYKVRYIILITLI